MVWCGEGSAVERRWCGACGGVERYLFMRCEFIFFFFVIGSIDPHTSDFKILRFFL